MGNGVMTTLFTRMFSCNIALLRFFVVGNETDVAEGYYPCIIGS